MNKKLFVETIEAIKEQQKYDNDVSLSLLKIFPNCFQANLLYDNSRIVKQIINILEVVMNDKNEWIKYFIYDLDFGKDYRDGCVIIDDENIDISDSSLLYDFLIKGID